MRHFSSSSRATKALRRSLLSIGNAAERPPQRKISAELVFFEMDNLKPEETSSLIIGVDGGGSKTVIQLSAVQLPLSNRNEFLFSDKCKVASNWHVRTSGTNPNAVGEVNAWNTLKEGLMKALEYCQQEGLKVDAVVLGISSARYSPVSRLRTRITYWRRPTVSSENASSCPFALTS